MPTLPKVLINQADSKSAGGVALRVRTQGMRCEASVPLHKPCSVPPGTVLALQTKGELFNVLCNSKIMPDCLVGFSAVPAPTSAAATGAVGPELLFLEIGHSKLQIRWPFIYIA